MPTYEYYCEKCGHRFDQFQSILAQPLSVCPEEFCGLKRWGKGSVKRAISGGAGLIFKGSGFYITDYRSEKYKEAAKKEAGTTSTTASKATGGDGKPAAGASSGSKPASSPTKS